MTNTIRHVAFRAAISFYFLLLCFLSRGQSLYMQCPPSVSCVPNITLAGGVVGTFTTGYIPVANGTNSQTNSWLKQTGNNIALPTGKNLVGTVGDGGFITLDQNGTSGDILLSSDGGVKNTNYIWIDQAQTQCLTSENNYGWTLRNTGDLLIGTHSLVISSGTLNISNSTPGEGKVLTSNANGDATWQTPSTSASVPSLSLTATPSVYIFSSSPNVTVVYGQTSLTSAQLLTLSTTTVSIEIIPSPGSGRFIEVLDMYAYLNFGTTQYSNSALTVRYNLNEQIIGTISGALMNTTSSKMSRTLATVFSGTGSVWDNHSLSLFASTALTGGDGSLTIYYTYVIRPFP